MKRLTSLLAVLSIVCGGVGSQGASPEAGGSLWANWRGPAFNGTSPARGLPEKLVTDGAGSNLLWVTPMGGLGNATPIVAGGRVYVTASEAASKKLKAICVDAATGKIEWNNAIADVPGTNVRNTYASPSAVADESGVYFFFGTSDIVAYDKEGKQRWSRRLSDEFKKIANDWVYSSSALLLGETLYVQVLQRSDRYGASYLVALNTKDGKTKWQVDRPTDAVGESHDSYTTPIPVTVKDATQLVILGGDYLTGHDVQTGKELWRFGGINPQKRENWRVIPSPVADAERIYITVARGVTTTAVKVGGSGNITSSHKAWSIDKVGSDSPTPALADGVLYVLDDKKTMHAIDAATGAKKGSVRLGDSVFYASPTVADGKVYCLSEGNEVFVLEAGTLKVLSQTTLDDKGSGRGSISVVDGKVYVRSANKLWCFGSK